MIELYDLIKYRNGIIILGENSTGKSFCIDILQKSIKNLY